MQSDQQQTMQSFRARVLDYYYQAGRDLPWRTDLSPYSILLSEVMLQQTQVARVMTKYREFFEAFPMLSSLAAASPEALLRIWKGLGYNRRALWLQRSAQIIIDRHDGEVPDDHEQLVALPGIGPNTAAAIRAYAFNQPVVFIETNIRRVFIHHFFTDQAAISDRALLPLITEAISGQDPRTWYWALMDYGTHLGQTVPNPNRRSRHYVKQARFEGSHRQLRGQLLDRALQGSFALQDFDFEALGFDLVMTRKAVAELLDEGFLSQSGQTLTIRGKQNG